MAFLRLLFGPPPSLAEREHLLDAAARRHDTQMLGSGGRRHIVESYGMPYGHPLLQPVMRLFGRLFDSGRIVPAPGKTRHSWFGGVYVNGSQGMHCHGGSGHSRLPFGAGSPEVQRSRVRKRHTLMVGYTVCGEAGRPFAVQCGHSPAAAVGLQHADLWVQCAEGQGKNAFRPPAYDGEPLSARLIRHGVPLTQGHFHTYMLYFDVEAPTAALAIAAFLRAAEDELRSMAGEQLHGVELPEQLPVQLMDSTASCTDAADVGARHVGSDGSPLALSDHWSLISLFRSQRHILKGLWRRLAPAPPGQPGKPRLPRTFLQVDVLRVLFAYCLLHRPSALRLPPGWQLTAEVQQRAQQVLAPDSVLAARRAAAREMAVTRLTAEEQRRRDELYPGGRSHRNPGIVTPQECALSAVLQLALAQ